MSSPEDLQELPIVILPDGIDIDSLRVTQAAPPPGDPAQEGLGRKGRKGSGSHPPLSRKLAHGALRFFGYTAAVAVLTLFIAFVTFGLRRDFLLAFYPSPGRLSAAHGDIVGPSGTGSCRSCHHMLGLERGCLGCHEEIASQLESRTGFHHYLLDGKERDCARCHAEHLGRDHRLVNELSWAGQDLEDFLHPHVSFRLEGSHRKLACQKCHEEKLAVPFTLPAFPTRPREHTHLGLRQDCVACHEDIHSGGMSSDCESCHGQDSFRPAARFDHSKHFPLEGSHEKVPCRDCHVIAAPGLAEETRLLPFDQVRGTRCEECHRSPHRTSFAGACETCHASPTRPWAAGRETMTSEAHALTGFRLLPPHDVAACEKCHDPALPYEKRHPGAEVAGLRRAEDACGGCHRDVHGGQFVAKHGGCLDCHDRLQFQPHRYPAEKHAGVFPLLDAHARADCAGCHTVDPATQVRTFVGTQKDCAGCHRDPHAGQFVAKGKGCADCHDTKRFLPSRMGLAEHSADFPLRGSHVAVPCISCHVKRGDEATRTFVSTSRECKTCHRDPHGAQFAEELERGDCTACHSEGTDTFRIASFDHARSTDYPLLGAHAEAKCNRCHREAKPSGAVDGLPVVAYRGRSRECSSCHVDVHRGQFLERGKGACGDCHRSTTSWPEVSFDHNAQSRFALDGAHVKLPCGSCHPRIRLDDGSAVIQFKPLATECNSCHEIKR